MKVFRVIDGVVCEASAPDGALCIEIGATLLPDGSTAPAPINRIVRSKPAYYQRRGSDERIPLPDANYRHRDLTWRPVAVADSMASAAPAV